MRHAVASIKFKSIHTEGMKAIVVVEGQLTVLTELAVRILMEAREDAAGSLTVKASAIP